MTWTPETLAKIKRLQAEAAAAGRDYGALSLAALNRHTLAEKAKMTDEQIKAEEASRRKHVFDPMTGRRRDTKRMSKQ